MPSKHLNPARVYRPDVELYERAQAAVAEVGSNMNAHVIEFLRWVAGDTDELPARPAPTKRRQSPNK
ncbi:hypothetical protein [Nocardia testacea]|uniref:Arc-like DNA binding domain-containing protein n=1 Tax=Nocardia testacea TaxID=248551 RepID=A0ABW7W1A3_9NOCA